MMSTQQRKARARRKAYEKRRNIAANTPKELRQIARAVSASPRPNGKVHAALPILHREGFNVQTPPVSRKRV